MIFKMNKSRLSRKIAATLMMWAAFPIGAFAAESNETNEDATEYVNMEDMLITAERIPTNKWDTPANIAIITAKEIEDNHYQDLAEALNSVNGVYVGTGTISDVVMMNGINRVVILVDGRRLSSPQMYESYTGQSITANGRADVTPIPSMKMIERIEIIKGGNSALYGSDAVGGVVNIITKKGRRNETTIDIKKAFGQSHRYGTEITNSGANERWGYFFTGSFGESNGDVMEDRYNNKGLSLRMDYRFDDRSSLTFNGMYRNYDKLFDFSAGLYNSIALTYNFKEGTSTPGWFRYYNNYSSPSILGNLRLQAIEYQNGWKLNKNNKLIVGLEWQKHKVHSLFYDYDGAINKGAIYLQDTMSIGNKWQVVPGVRLDYQESTGSHWSPKIAVNYRSDEKTKFYTSWGRVHTAPSATSLSGPETRYKGNPNLLPESGQAFSIGFEHAFDEKSNVSANYFYSYVDNIIDSSITYNGFDNVFREKQHGIELAFNQKLSDKWSYGVGYTHADTEFEYPQVWNWGSQYDIPTDSLSFGIKYRCGAWKASLTNTTYYFFRHTYSSVRNDNRKNKDIDNWLDFTASYDVDEHYTIYTKIKNIGNRTRGEDAEGGAKFDRPGRYYLLGATYKF